MGTRIFSPRRHIHFIFLGILVLVLSTNGVSETYYADLTITVDSSGYVTIDGLTNHPDLIVQNTQQYTSKKQSYWVLNITKQETFSEFVYTLILPEGSSINYIKSSTSLRIEEKLGRLIVNGYGENESLSLLVQYQIEKRQGGLLQANLVYVVLLLSILLVSALLILLIFRERRNKRTDSSGEIKKPHEPIKGLNHRQQQIIQLLHQRDAPVTQTDIQKELKIPKASVSRNIRGLERKGLIQKEQMGMSNLIRLKKQ